MADSDRQLTAVHRETSVAGDARTVLVRRTYQADIADVWDAITSMERINRWFMPVTGELRLGGHYQLEGNAGGQILDCEPPRRLRVSWVMGEEAEADFSEVEVRLSSGDAGETVFELEHSAVVDPGLWAQFGPGGVGVGWDLTVLGLGRHLESSAGVSAQDRAEWMVSDEAREFMTASSAAWGAAHVLAGASPEEAASTAENTRNAYLAG